MDEKVIREIKFEKGDGFTTKFILHFEKEWAETVEKLKSSGARLDIPLVKK